MPGPQRERVAGRGGRWSLHEAHARGTRRQVVGVGLGVVGLYLLVVTTGLEGMRQVEAAHAGVARIDVARGHFQDADMAHDAIRAEALVALDALENPADPLSHGGVDGVRAGVVDFLADLDRVDDTALPPALAEAVAGVRPQQDAYARNALTLAEMVTRASPAPGRPPDAAAVARARATMARVEAGHARLVRDQGVVTDAMGAESLARRIAAAEDERAVRQRLGLSAALALVGLGTLAVLVDRLGRRLVGALDRERGVAETLQHSLLPEELPDLPGVRLAARYRAGSVGTEVGGDWYDVITLPGGQVGLVVGDVVGHDLRAAAAMGQLRNALRACAAEGGAPEEVLTRLNRLCVVQGLGDLATVVYAVLDPVRAEVHLASAGHYPPLLVAGGDATWLEAPVGPPVGAVREPLYGSARHDLPAGSVLLLYTDGLVERRGESVDAGLQRLRVTLRRLLGTVPGKAVRAGAVEGATLQRLCDDVLGAVTAGQPVVDDVALLLVAPQALLGPRVEVVWPARAETLAAVRHTLDRWLGEAGAAEDERYEVLVAVSEAATNAVEHAYGPSPADLRLVFEAADDGAVVVTVRDWGRWRAPRGQDRGRGLALMEGLVDEVDVVHGRGGTEVTLRRRLREPAWGDTPAGGAVRRRLVRSG